MAIALGVIAYIPNSRQRDLLERALESISTLETDEPVNLVLVDNGNRDPGARKFILDLAVRFHARYLRRATSDIAAARDLVLLETTGARYFGFVDSDVEVPPTWLVRLRAELDHNEKVVGAATPNHPPRGSSPFEDILNLLMRVSWNSLGSAQTRQLEISERQKGLQEGAPGRSPEKSQKKSLKKMVQVGHLSSCAVLYRRNAVLEVGGYNHNFTSVCEDLELSVRLSRIGEFRLLAEPAVIHRQDISAVPWLKRIFRYGWGQIEVMRAHPRQIFSLKGALLPLSLIFLLLIVVALVGKDWRPVLFFLTLYIVPVWGGVFCFNRKAPLLQKFFAGWLTMGTHFAYVFGMILGLFRIKTNPNLELISESVQHWDQDDIESQSQKT